jgi:hypothetical protein
MRSGNWKKDCKVSTKVEKVKTRKRNKFGRTSELMDFFVWGAFSKFKDSDTRKDDAGDENGVDDYI